MHELPRERRSLAPSLFGIVSCARADTQTLPSRTARLQGTTRLLLTSIPYFREVVVMSFRCEHCGEANTEIQSAGMIQGASAPSRFLLPPLRLAVTADDPTCSCCCSASLVLSLPCLLERGSTYTVHVRNPDDLSRQLVKSPTATITIPEFSLTIPPGKGQLTNVEGVVRDTYRDLELDQPVRKVMDPDTWAKIEALLTQLRAAVGDAVEEEGARTWEGRNRGELGEDGEGRPEQGDEKRRRTSDAVAPAAAAAPTAAETAFVPFTITVDDPSGNSFLAFHETISDPKWALRTYVRSRAQDEGLGLVAPAADGGPPEEEYVDRGEGRFENEEIYSFPSTCSSCQGALDTLMKKVNIPYFQVRPPSLLPGSPCARMLTPSLALAGHHHHVDQLPVVRLQGQRGQVWRRRLGPGQADRAPGRGRRGPVARPAQGAFRCLVSSVSCAEADL